MDEKQKPLLRQICIVLDSTFNMKQHFDFVERIIVQLLQYVYFVKNLFLEIYVEKVINKFTGMFQYFFAHHRSQYALVLFKDYPPYADYLVRVINFRDGLQEFLTILHNVNFKAGGDSRSALGEGLAACIEVCSVKLLICSRIFLGNKNVISIDLKNMQLLFV